MQVILLEKVTNLGTLGDVVRVKDGYARNFLIPQGKATVATAANIAKFEVRRAELEAKAAAELGAAQARAKKFEGLVIKITMQAGAEGKLFGSVGTVDIAEAVGKTCPFALNTDTPSTHTAIKFLQTVVFIVSWF